MANISKIQTPNGTTYDIKDTAARAGLNAKISEPSADGTSGQVLATNGSGGRYWKTVSGGGGGGGISITNVWTNPSPTSSFTAKTVSVDLSGYDYFIADFVTRTASGAVNYTMFIPQKDITYRVHTAQTYSGKYVNVWRNVTVSDTGIAFGAGNRDADSDNSYAIPVALYGIS